MLSLPRILVDFYARRFLAGQKSLFDEPAKNPEFEAKHPREPDGTFAEKEGGYSGDESLHAKASAVLAKIPFVSAAGMAKQLGVSHEQGEALLAAIKQGSPATESADAEDDADDEDPNDTPRDRAAKATQRMDDNYAFARASEVPNAGEDLIGSARHKVNAWRGLDEAERDGTAQELVTRDHLLRNEPHGLASHVRTNFLTALTMHLALKAFPAKPGFGKNYRPSEEDAKKDRRQFVEAYRTLKSQAESLAAAGKSAPDAIGELQTTVRNLIRSLRGQQGMGYMAEVQSADPYNATANSLIGLQKALHRHAHRSNVMAKVGEFSDAVKEKYGDNVREYSSDVREAIEGHVLDLLEGKSLAKSFGQETGGTRGKRFNAADRYVKHAVRKGGRVIDADTVRSGTDFMIGKLKMRGLQWGNSVSDAERVHHLSKSAEAMADLVDVLGLPDEAASLNGVLGLAIGARGHGNAMAHYEPGTKVINLTRASGVGSLAHEWGHFFDHHLGGGGIVSDGKESRGSYLSLEESPKRFVKENGKWKVDPATNKMVTVDRSQEPLWSAMDKVRENFKSSGFTARLKTELQAMINDGSISADKANNYWRTPHEMFARAFESYVQRKLRKAGRDNTYLAGLGIMGGLWPTEQETDAMTPAFDWLFAAYRQQAYPNHQRREL